MNVKVDPQTLVGFENDKYRILDVFFKKKKNYFKIECVRCLEQSDVRCDVLNKRQKLCLKCDGNPMYKTKTYNSWDGIVQRTTNPNSASYYKYGAVGIGCFEDWRLPDGEGWKNFFEYMGECPPDMTLDRWPDKNGNYEPGNVRWATNSEQGYNQKKRNTNTSGRTGVYWNEGKKKWQAFITVNNKSMYLMRSDSFEEAVKAREEAELKYFGENKE